MVTTIKTWVTNLNHALGSTTDQVIQYQNAMYELSQRFVDAGWEHAWSTDGTNQSTTVNQWSNAASIVIAPSGTAHSMIILKAPTTWGNPTSGNRYHLLLSCEDPNATPNTTPDDFYFIFHSAAFTNNSLTTKPATPTGAVGSSAKILGWTGAAAGRASFWRTTGTYQGDVLAFTKLVTSGSFTMAFGVVDPIYTRGTLAGNTAANRGLIFYLASGTIANFTSATIGGTAQDASLTTAPVFSTVTTSTTSWADGADANGQAGFFPIFVVNNATAQRARYYGHLPDIWALSGGSTTLWNFNDTSDTGSTVLRGFNGIGLPVPSSAAALE